MKLIKYVKDVSGSGPGGFFPIDNPIGSEPPEQQQHPTLFYPTHQSEFPKNESGIAQVHPHPHVVDKNTFMLTPASGNGGVETSSEVEDLLAGINQLAYRPMPEIPPLPMPSPRDVANSIGDLLPPPGPPPPPPPPLSPPSQQFVLGLPPLTELHEASMKRMARGHFLTPPRHLRQIIGHHLVPLR